MTKQKRLEAAAPALLEACEKALACFDAMLHGHRPPHSHLRVANDLARAIALTLPKCDKGG